MPALLSVFDLPDEVVSAVTKLKKRGFDDIETYSPAPFLDIDDAVDPKPSKVRIFTLIGAVTVAVGTVRGEKRAHKSFIDGICRLGLGPYDLFPGRYVHHYHRIGR